MFSECEDDLCIFVCGTCKRYFTQLSAFSQHKKEKLCKKKDASSASLKDSSLGQHSTQDLSEENEADENLAETTTGINDAGNDAEDNSQRKYPRKQDKKLIKRTIRELENGDENLLGAEGKLNVSSSYQGTSHDFFPSNALALRSPEMQRSCKHPIYVCKSCHAEFPNTNGRVFKCVDCRRGFYTEADLNQHMVRAKHNNLCAVCGKIFPDKYKLRKHELSHVTEKNFRCEEPGCTKSFKSAEDVRTHVRYVHAVEKRFHCTHCPRAFTRLDKYKLHMNTHGISLKPGPVSPTLTGMKALVSNPLGIKTSPEEQTPGALSIYHSTPVSAADDASGVVQTLEFPANVNSHPSPGHDDTSTSTEADVGKSEALKGASAIVPYSSSSTYSSSVDNYENSIVNVEVQNEQEASKNSISPWRGAGILGGEECQRCQTSFKTSIEYLAHEERRADHVLRCGHCSGKFLSVCELRSHVREQHGVQFLPPLEPKVPALESGKKQRKHFCQECGKGFTRPDKLKRHTIIHSPDRPCIPCMCKESHGCERTFYRNDSMKRHALTHTLDKPYNCEDCGKTFSRPDYLTKHIGHVHKRAFKHLCTLCDYGTREAKRLKIHIRSKHELDPDLFLSTEGSESSLGPSMANPGETDPVESPRIHASPGEMDPPTRELASPDEEMTSSIGHINPGEMRPVRNPGEMNIEEMNLGQMNPQEMSPKETNHSNTVMESRDIVQHTGRMNPSIGETTSSVIEPLTSELTPEDMRTGEIQPGDMRSGDLHSGDLHSGDLRSGDLRSGDMRSGDMHSGDMRSGDMHSGDLRSGDLRSGDMRSGDLRSGDLRSGDLRSGDMHSGDMRSGDMHSGDLRSGDLRSGDLHSHGIEIDRNTRVVSPSPDEINQVAGEIDPGERYQHGGIETPGTLGSPDESQSPERSSPVTRQSVISQDFGVPELRLIQDFQDVPRHNFSEGTRRSTEFLGEQSVRARFPFGYPPQDMRSQYSMPADFTAISHQSGLTQFPPHQSVFSNVHMQFPGGGAHLPNYERKTPLNSRPVSSQSPFWP